MTERLIAIVVLKLDGMFLILQLHLYRLNLVVSRECRGSEMKLSCSLSNLFVDR